MLGPDVKTSLRGLAELPFVPAILGFDPRLQLVHEDDVANALFHATEHDLPGVFNVAADGVLALSEIAGLLGKPFMPFLPPWGTGLALAPLRRLGVRVPPELMNLLRFGRGVDNRKLKATGFTYRYTTREAVLKLGEHLRLSPILKGAREPYRYEREVEEFLRWSPSVQGSESPLMRMSPAEIAELQKLLEGIASMQTAASPPPAAPEARAGATGARGRRGAGAPGPRSSTTTNELESEEIIALLGSMERRRAGGPARARIRLACAPERAPRDRLRPGARPRPPADAIQIADPGYLLVMGNPPYLHSVSRAAEVVHRPCLFPRRHAGWRDRRVRV